MISYLFRGIAVGLLFGIPAGAVGAMTAQRTWHDGGRAGLLTGLGSSAADCFYACVGAFGLTFISDFLLKYQSMINTAGGSLIFLMGIRLLYSSRISEDVRQKIKSGTTVQKNRIGLFLSSFAVGITNPAAILTFLFAFSWFGLTGQAGILHGTALVLGVFIGTYIWWGTLTGLVLWLKRKAKRLKMSTVNRVFGIILCGFGMVVLVRNFLI